MFRAQDFAARLARREDRWSLLKDFVAEWHTPLKEGDGYAAAELDAAEQRLGLKLQPALREYYLLVGQREDIVAKQNFLVSPDELEVQDGLLVFYSENQSVVEWGVRRRDLKLDDPPVYLNDSGMHETPQKPIRENETLSAFVLQMLVLETACFNKYGGNAIHNAEAVETIRQNFVPLDFPEWHWSSPCCLYGGDDILAAVFGASEGSSEMIFVGANGQEALSRVSELLALKYYTDDLE